MGISEGAAVLSRARTYLEVLSLAVVRVYIPTGYWTGFSQFLACELNFSWASSQHGSLLHEIKIGKKKNPTNDSII